MPEVAYKHITNNHFVYTAKDKNLAKLERISLLGDNWNGYGAAPLPDSTIFSAKNLIRNLFFQPEIFPTPDGTIQIEYEKDNGDYLEFQFDGQGTCEVFKSTGDNEEYFTSQDSSEAINALVEAFYEQ